MYMGIHPRDMRTQAAAIAEFTELGDYLDMPVRTYSAGMMIRLAFSISTCIPPDILIMDEWLSAGDAQFLARRSGESRNSSAGRASWCSHRIRWN
jgi:ABC-2 type transport system ATP-binding protein/lipopolysaccharide transport system ATP-binding protein